MDAWRVKISHTGNIMGKENKTKAPPFLFVFGFFFEQVLSLETHL